MDFSSRCFSTCIDAGDPGELSPKNILTQVHLCGVVSSDVTTPWWSEGCVLIVIWVTDCALRHAGGEDQGREGGREGASRQAVAR